MWFDDDQREVAVPPTNGPKAPASAARPWPTTRALARGLAAIVTCACLAAACSDSGSDSGSGTQAAPSAGVSQGGAQDFGLFRDLISDGEIPAPQTLDDVGFFNEHKIEFPAPDCGENVCVHASLGVMGNMLSGANCTLLLVGMNTPIDPANLPRRPLDLVVAIDTSGSMQGEPIQAVKRGLTNMLDALEPEDRVTLVSYDRVARVTIDRLAPEDPALAAAIDGLIAEGGTNVYDGLRLAYDRVLADGGPENSVDRVILLSDGVANTGITSTDRIVRMSSAYAEEGVGVTTIGLGTEFNVDLMRTLSETGSGNFYFLEDAQAVEEVFREEVQTFLVSIAEDVRLRFAVAPGYRLGGIFGTKLASLGENVGWIEIPSLFVAQRTSSADVGMGRRGGGGAIVIELLPDGETTPEPGPVGDLTMTYRDPDTGEEVTQAVPIVSPLAPGDTPEGGFFDDLRAQKAFVMLNIFVGLQMSTGLAEIGDDRGALGVVRTLENAVSTWLAGPGASDPDIADDLAVIRELAELLRDRGAAEPSETFASPEITWPYD